MLDFAFDHASRHRLPLTVVHASRDATGTEEADRQRWLAESLSGHSERYPDVYVSTVLVHARPARTLLRVASTMNLLVVGQHTPVGLHEPPVGHVRSSIVDRCPCPTAVVPLPVLEPAPSEEPR